MSKTKILVLPLLDISSYKIGVGGGWKGLTLMRETGRKLKIDAHEYKPNPYIPHTLKTHNSHQTAMLETPPPHQISNTVFF